MFARLCRLSSVLAIAMTFSLPIHAQDTAVSQLKEQTTLQFAIQPDALSKGEVHYAWEILSPKKLMKKYPDLADLDPGTLLDHEGVKIEMSKTAYVVNHSAQFFTSTQVLEETYVKALNPEANLKKLEENEFEVQQGGALGEKFQLKIFYDSDDLSTIQQSRLIHSVTQSKKLDPLSLGSSSTVCSTLKNFSKSSAEGIIVTNHVPLSSNKTLVITYRMIATKSIYAQKHLLQPHFLKHSETVVQQINTFKK